MESAGEFAAPWAHPIGNGFKNPDADLGVAVDTILPAIGLLKADAEEPDRRLVAHGGAKLFGGLAHEPGCGESMASLTVYDKHGRAAAGFNRVERVERTAAVVRNHAGLGVDGANLAADTAYLDSAGRCDA